MSQCRPTFQFRARGAPSKPPDPRLTFRLARASAIVGLATLFAFGEFVLAPPSEAQTQPLESEDLPDPGDPAPPATRPGSDADALLDLERLAEESFAQEDLTTAVALYRQLAERHTDLGERIRVMMIVAWLQHQTGSRGQALQTMTDVLLLNPSYRFRAELYSEDFAPLFYDAQKRALQLRESKAANLVLEGSGLLRQKRYQEAREKLGEAIETWPDQAMGIYNLALVDYYENRTDDALDGFQKVLALAVSKPEIVNSGLEASALTNLALVYLQRNQAPEASDALRRAVVLDPTNATAWLNLGIAWRRQGESQRAAEAYRRAWDLNRDDVNVGRNLALAYLDAGDPSAAAGHLEDATQKNPDDAGLWLYMGLARKSLGDPAGAISALRSAMAKDPDNRGTWAGQAALQLAVLHYAQADYENTRREAERVVDWLPEQTNGWVYLGLAQQSLGDLSSAAASLESAKRLAPTRADIHNSAGSVYFEMGRFDEAEKAFQRALELAPDMAEARRNLDAVLTVKRGDAVAATRRASGRAQSPPVSSRSTRTPTPQRPGLGIRFSEVDYPSLGLQGVMVDRVYPDTPAGRAGIQSEDLLLKMDGRPIAGEEALRRYAAGIAKGQILVLELLRDNRPVTVRVTVP